ncbi:Uncharacterised protein [Segatella copri]|nr:Uncharacterised protein [Segatella copri]
MFCYAKHTLFPFFLMAYLSTVSAKRAMIMSIPAMVTRMSTSFL